MTNKIDRYNGILLIDKEIGMTSHDVVAKLRRIVNQKKIGHTGTLDKAASGLLVVCLGRSTKTAQFITDSDKKYQTEITFGRTSKTYDAEGVDSSQEEKDTSFITTNLLVETLNCFTGEIEQKVPAYSAVHQDGERLYKKANKGLEIDLPSRNITIYENEFVSLKDNKLSINVSCSKGTYIRSLAHDIGEKLNCGGYVSKLRRTAVGSLVIENAFRLNEIEDKVTNGTLDDTLLQFTDVTEFASCSVNDSYVDSIYNGKDIFRDYIQTVSDSFNTGDKVAIRDLQGKVLAVCRAEVPSNLIDNTIDQKLFSYIRVLN